MKKVSKGPKGEGLGSLLYKLFVSKEYQDKGLAGWKDDKEKFKIDLINDIKDFLFTKWEKPWIAGLIFDEKGRVVLGFRNIYGRVFKEQGNVLGLERNKGESPYFITLNKVTELKATVLDRSKFTTILSYIPIFKDKEKASEKPDYMLPKFHSVINIDFVDGIKKPIFKVTEFKNLELNEYVERFIEQLKLKGRIPKLVYDQADRAYYTHSQTSWGNDSIHLAPIKQFKNIEGYYSVLFHEITHSTMNPTRCGRGKNGKKAGLSYANEELVAEMGAMIVCSELGLKYNRQNSITYLKGWLRNATGNTDDALVEAYAYACDAAQYLLDGIDFESLVPKTMTKRAEGEAVEIEPEKPTNNSSSKVEVLDLPILEIHTDEKRFQNRKGAISEDSKNRIVNAVTTGTFEWSKFDPITVWKDGSKYYVLSGHSRFAAFKELKRIGTIYDGYGFANIPVKIFKGSEAEAIDLALNSNTLSTKETDVERAMYYNRSRSTCEMKNLKGLGAKTDCEKAVESACREAEGKNANFIINLSYLDPDGFLIDNLARLGAEKDNDSTNVLRTVANWIGEARRSNPEISAIQETEIAKFLLNGGYGNKSGQFRSKTQFNERLAHSFSKWTARGAKPGDPLNLANTLSKSSFEKEFNDRLVKAKQALDEAVYDHEEKHKKYLYAVMDGSINQERMNELMRPIIAWVLNCKKEYERIRGQKEDVKKATEAQTSLFGVGPAIDQKGYCGLKGINKVKKAKTYSIGGEVGKFLGPYERQNYSIVLRGDKGAGKSRFLYQLMDAFATKKHRVAFISLEMGSGSSVSQSYRNAYVKPGNQKRIDITDQPLSYDELDAICKMYEVVAVDSWTKLRGLKQMDFDRLQKANPRTILIAIFQSTTGKVTRGGNMPEFDAAIVIHVHAGGVAECEKNRYAATDRRFSVFDKKVIREEQAEQEGAK